MPQNDREKERRRRREDEERRRRQRERMREEKKAGQKKGAKEDWSLLKLLQFGQPKKKRGTAHRAGQALIERKRRMRELSEKY